MHIGLIGGIGPAATIAYYGKLVKAFRDAELPLELTIAHADVATLIANATGDRREEQATVFKKHLQQLRGAGCDVATITALTGHFCFGETKAQSPLPLESAIAPIDRYCKEHGIQTIGLLGSPSVMTSRLFGQLENVRCLIPTSDLDGLGNAYLELASSGVCYVVTRKRFFDAGAEMTNELEVDAVLLAGTDLGLVFDGFEPGFRIVDALAIHVDSLVDLAHG